MPFETNVFINCPFDKEYKPILKSIVFSLVYLGYNPLLSETINAAETRIAAIQNLIQQAKYSIHDLSRMKAAKKNELARFNMPFELGLDIGCRRFGGEPFDSKCLLVLDEELYRIKRALSDLAGSDIQFHDNQPEKAVREVRNWIRKFSSKHIDSANKIWESYNEFLGDFSQIAQEKGLSNVDIDEMPWNEFSDYIRAWLQGNQSNPSS